MARRINHHNRPNGASCGWSGTEVSPTYKEAGCIGPSFGVYAPCPDSRVLCPAGEIQLGDCVDLRSLPGEISEPAKSVAEFEYSPITEETTREAGRVWIHTFYGSYGVAPDHQLVIGPHQPDWAKS